MFWKKVKTKPDNNKEFDQLVNKIEKLSEIFFDYCDVVGRGAEFRVISCLPCSKKEIQETILLINKMVVSGEMQKMVNSGKIGNECKIFVEPSFLADLKKMLLCLPEFMDAEKHFVWLEFSKISTQYRGRTKELIENEKDHEKFQILSSKYLEIMREFGIEKSEMHKLL